MNVSRLWAYNAGLVTGLFDLMRHAISEQRTELSPSGNFGRRLCVDSGRLLLLARLGFEAGLCVRPRNRCRSDPR